MTLRTLLRPQPHWTVRALTEATGRSRSWVKKWRARVRSAPPEDDAILQSRSCARKHPPPALSQAVIDHILEIRDIRPASSRASLVPRPSCPPSTIPTLRTSCRCADPSASMSSRRECRCRVSVRMVHGALSSEQGDETTIRWAMSALSRGSQASTSNGRSSNDVRDPTPAHAMARAGTTGGARPALPW